MNYCRCPLGSEWLAHYLPFYSSTHSSVEVFRASFSAYCICYSFTDAVVSAAMMSSYCDSATASSLPVHNNRGLTVY